MPQINIAELVDDPDFSQTFTVTRQSGTWTNGRFEPTSRTFTVSGVINPMSTKDIEMLPAADVIHGGIAIHTTVPIYTTTLNESTGNSGNASDEITWQGEQFKIIQVSNYADFGYYKALATRKLGA